MTASAGTRVMLGSGRLQHRRTMWHVTMCLDAARAVQVKSEVKRCCSTYLEAQPHLLCCPRTNPERVPVGGALALPAAQGSHGLLCSHAKAPSRTSQAYHRQPAVAGHALRLSNALHGCHKPLQQPTHNLLHQERRNGPSSPALFAGSIDGDSTWRKRGRCREQLGRSSVCVEARGCSCAGRKHASASGRNTDAGSLPFFPIPLGPPTHRLTITAAAQLCNIAHVPHPAYSSSRGSLT